MNSEQVNHELVRQVREAFGTVILSDRFLTDEEWQLELLAVLNKNLKETGAAVDAAIEAGRAGGRRH